MNSKKLFLIFTISSILELSLLIYLGGLIGFWNSLIVIIITAMIGSFLVRRAGAEIMIKLQQAMYQQQGISDAVLDGGILIFSGALLVTPGFLSDAVGILIHIPFIKEFVKRILKAKFSSFFQQKTGFGFQSENKYYENNKTINLDDFYM